MTHSQVHFLYDCWPLQLLVPKNQILVGKSYQHVQNAGSEYYYQLGFLKGCHCLVSWPLSLHHNENLLMFF